MACTATYRSGPATGGKGLPSHVHALSICNQRFFSDAIRPAGDADRPRPVEERRQALRFLIHLDPRLHRTRAPVLSSARGGPAASAPHLPSWVNALERLRSKRKPQG
jgi:hypothetical protein